MPTWRKAHRSLHARIRPTAKLAVVSLAALLGCSGRSPGTVSPDGTMVSIVQAAARHVDTTFVGGKRYLYPIVLDWPRDSSRPPERWDSVSLSTLRSTLKATVGLLSANELFTSDSAYNMILRFGRPTRRGDGSYDLTVGFVARQGTQVRSLTLQKVGEEWAVVNDQWIGGT